MIKGQWLLVPQVYVSTHLPSFLPPSLPLPSFIHSCNIIIRQPLGAKHCAPSQRQKIVWWHVILQNEMAGQRSACKRRWDTLGDGRPDPGHHAHFARGGCTRPELAGASRGPGAQCWRLRSARGRQRAPCSGVGGKTQQCVRREDKREGTPLPKQEGALVSSKSTAVVADVGGENVEGRARPR